MNLINKIPAAAFAAMLVAANAAAAAGEAEKEPSSAESGVIFRIENINPVKNKDDLVSKCEFFVTAYNRMDKSVEEAVLNLSWTDDVSAKYKVEDGKVKTEKDKEKAKTVITKEVTLKDIAPHKQKSFKEVVDTDKCFLLLDSLEYKVSSCIAEGDNIKIKDNKRVGSGSCAGVFDYVNSQNPEYYSEFKDLSAEELEKMAREESKADTKVVDDLYKNTLDLMKKTTETLDRIK